MLEIGEQGLVLLSDTPICPGHGPLLSITKEFHSRPLFISVTGNYAHYKALFRKYALNPVYLELESGWHLEEFPLLESPPMTWLDPPDRATLSTIEPKLTKAAARTHCAVVENLQDVLYLSDFSTTLSFVNLLRILFPSVIIRVPESVLQTFKLLEQSCVAFLELRPLESGFSEEFTGKARLSKRIDGVRVDSDHWWYSIKQNQYKLTQ